MNRLYDNLKEETLKEEEYVSNVHVIFSHEDINILIEGDTDLEMKYGLDVMKGVDGILGIEPIFEKEVEVEVLLVYAEDREEEKIYSVNPAELKILWEEGKGYYPVEVMLVIGEDDKIDMQNSFIRFSYLNPEIV
jgi:hypothetical protein